MPHFKCLKNNLWFLEMLAVSIAYILAFFLTHYLFYPLQLKIIPEFESLANLMYLPHGVRVLAAWLLGWRSVVAIAPGAFVSQNLLFEQPIWDFDFFGVFFIGIVVAPLAFSLLKFAKFDASAREENPPCWQCVMVVGIFASLLNALLANLVLGTLTIDFLGYLVGDVSGLFFLVLILMLVFRQMRAWGY